MESKDFVNPEGNKPEKGAENIGENPINEKENELKNTEEISSEKTPDKETSVEELSSEESSKIKSEEKQEKETVSVGDYSQYDKAELITKLNTLINNHPVNQIKSNVDRIKTEFYRKHNADIEMAKEKFIEEDGKIEDFKFSDDSTEETFKELYKQFRTKKAELAEQAEKQKKENLKTKYQIIEEISELINKEESINKTFQEFRDLQQKWRDAGLVPQNEVKGLWESYNHTVEKFYDYININKELRDLDLKKNLESKINLCEKAESLLLEESVVKAFRMLQDYHNMWRETGPVPIEQKEDIWDRFKAATTQINKKHQNYFEEQKEQQIKNLEQKEALCEKMEELQASEKLKPKDWEEKTQEALEIQKLWRTIGFAPKKDNSKIYNRFKTACDDFFISKRDFYKEAKEIQKNNIQLRVDLCVQAEALKESTEWKKTTEDFIQLQKKWKEIGFVPKKYSEPLWERFRTACNHFFDTKSEFFNSVDSGQEENLELKKQLIDKVKNYEKGDNEKDDLKKLMDIQKEWTNIGHVPFKEKDAIQKEFRDVLDQQFEKLKININEREKLNFKTKVEGWVNSNSQGKLYTERNKLVSKIKELENEISLYENNVGFFSKSKNAESLLSEVNKKINKAKERKDAMVQKLRFLDKADKTE